jgi:hypothetical protein
MITDHTEISCRTESNYMKACETVETEINPYIQIGGRQPRNIGREQLPAFGEADRRWCW